MSLGKHFYAFEERKSYIGRQIEYTGQFQSIYMQASPKQKTAVNEAAYTGSIPRSPMRFLWFATKPYWKRALATVLLVTLAQLLAIALPYVLKRLVDALSGVESTEALLDAFVRWGLLYVVFLICMFAGWRLSGLVGIPWFARSRAYSFKRLYEYVNLHSHTYFANRFAGSISNKISNASDGADALTDQIVGNYYPSVLSLVGTSVLLFMTSFYLGLIFVALVVVLVVVNARFVRRRRPLVVSYVESSSALRGVSVDLLTNIIAVRQFGRRSFEEERLKGYVDDRHRKQMQRDMIRELGMFINNALVILAIMLMMVVLYGGVREGLLTAGDVVLVISLIWSTSYQLVFIGNMLNGFIRIYSEIDEGLGEILVPHEIVDHTDARALTVSRGEVEWKNVTFGYEGNTVFSDFQLTIPPGQRVGLVGSSGAGKTTFVSLLLRQHELGGGAICIDGQNIAEVTQESLRTSIAIVPQEATLFHRTIRENIAYGNPDASEEEIIAVAQKAQAHDFISALPKGYDTLVGERGIKLSGGQKQRVAIARAMLKSAPILVLDEATSALDSESEVAIQKALHELMVGKTVIAIAHRLSTLREMDRIIVLQDGKIVEDGTHATLTQKNGGVYAKLWDHQAGGFLLD